MNSLIPWKRGGVQSNGQTTMAPVSQMRWDWDRMFDRLLDDVWTPASGTSPGMLLDLAETDDEIRVRAEVPGMNPGDLDVSLTGDVLTLSGQKLDEDEGKNEGRHYSERSFGVFKRAVKLPCAVDPDRVSAEHRNGVVTITLQKADTVKPKRIQVKSAG